MLGHFFFGIRMASITNGIELGHGIWEMASGKWHRIQEMGQTLKWHRIQNGIEASELGQTLVLIIPTTVNGNNRVYEATGTT